MKVFLPTSVTTLLILTTCQQKIQAPIKPITITLTTSPIPNILDNKKIYDTNNENFVQRIIPLLLKQRPTSIHEITLLLSVIEQKKQKTLIQTLMRTKTFTLQ